MLAWKAMHCIDGFAPTNLVLYRALVIGTLFARRGWTESSDLDDDGNVGGVAALGRILCDGTSHAQIAAIQEWGEPLCRLLGDVSDLSRRMGEDDFDRIRVVRILRLPLDRGVLPLGPLDLHPVRWVAAMSRQGMSILPKHHSWAYMHAAATAAGREGRSLLLRSPSFTPGWPLCRTCSQRRRP